MAYRSLTQIAYVIPMETGMTEASFSQFCGFSQEFIVKSYFLSIISMLPQYVEELSRPSNENIAKRRDIGDYRIILLNAEALAEIPVGFFTPFVCVFSTNNTYQASIKFLETLKYKAIHVSEVARNGELLPHQINNRVMKKEFFSAVKSYFRSEGENIPIPIMKIFSGRPKSHLPNKLKLKGRTHNIVRPMECALRSQRYKLRGQRHLGYGGVESYVEGILDLVRNINRVRGSVSVQYGTTKNDFVLGLPSFYAYIYKDRQLLDAILKNAGKLVKNFFEKHLLRYRGYVATNVKVDDISDITDNSHIAYLSISRQKELFAFTNLMSIISSEDFSPYIRLPNDLNLMHGMWDTIESLVKGATLRRTEKINNEFTKINSHMHSVIPQSILQTIQSCGRKGLIFSDYPIEWLCLENDVPLQFTHEVCRIGSTPGNILAEIVCNTGRVEFPLEALKQILVIRSFQKDDPIRPFLEDAVNIFSRNFTGGTEVIFKDVHSENELYEVLNRFRPFFAVFDCHGNHGGRADYAWLQIGKDKVDVWKMRGKCHVPAVCALSACSTHPVAGSHASVANGLLASGVVSVLATSVPIPAIEAASIVARLIYRIDTFLPLYLELFNKTLSWRDLVNKMLRMSYSTDILKSYRDVKPQWINDEQYRAIHQQINEEINYGRLDWHKKIFNLVSQVSHRSLEDVKRFYIRNSRFDHTAFYIQMGRPDKLIIFDSNRI